MQGGGTKEEEAELGKERIEEIGSLESECPYDCEIVDDRYQRGRNEAALRPGCLGLT